MTKPTKPTPTTQAARRILGKIRDVVEADIATADDPTTALGALGVRAIADWIDGELTKREERAASPACSCGAVDVAGVELHQPGCPVAKTGREETP